MARSMKRQALILTAGNVFTRGLGFALHLLFARLMGAEALGVMEMAHSAGMLALTPVTAGIPTAMSRLTAARPRADQPSVLHAGLHLVRRIALATMLALLLFAPGISLLLGDLRTLPALLCTVPCLLLLGYCSVYGGYCYGLQDTLTPALSECLEQSVRFLLSGALLLTFASSSVAIAAMLPEVAGLIAAGLSLALFVRMVGLPRSRISPSRALQKDLLHLSVPSALSRLCVTAMRTLNAVLLPVCLRRSGLSASAATAQFGLLNGMAMPLLMLPGMVTGAVCMVATPAVSRLEHQPRALHRLALRLSAAAAVIGIAAALLLWFGAEVISAGLYAQPALAPLLRLMAPLSIVLALHQVLSGMIAGLGLQRRALTGTLLSSALSLVLTALLAQKPSLRLFGAAIATICGQVLGLCWHVGVLIRARFIRLKSGS